MPDHSRDLGSGVSLPAGVSVFTLGDVVKVELDLQLLEPPADGAVASPSGPSETSGLDCWGSFEGEEYGVGVGRLIMQVEVLLP